MIYLLDASVLITAHNLYYPIDGVPEFWSWLAHQGGAGNIKLPVEIFEEIKDGGTDDERDLLYGWVREADTRRALLLDEEVEPALVRRVLDTGYANDLSDDELEQIGRDPFLIAYGLASPADRCVVTVEASKPTMRRQNRRIPDVCASLGVPCCDTFGMSRALQFRTNWQG